MFECVCVSLFVAHRHTHTHTRMITNSSSLSKLASRDLLVQTQRMQTHRGAGTALLVRLGTQEINTYINI